MVISASFTAQKSYIRKILNSTRVRLGARWGSCPRDDSETPAPGANSGHGVGFGFHWYARRQRASGQRGSVPAGGPQQGSIAFVGWVIWIERIAINADVQGIAAVLDDALSPFVALATKTLQRTQAKLVSVAPMRLDMVSDRCRGDDAARETESA
jgi:hypothetical protein